MGIITVGTLQQVGIPRRIVIELARLSESKAFVETGTFHGATTRWASENFAIVHTIERAESLYSVYSTELAQIEGVTAHCGDSRQVLPQIVHELRDQRVVYWLDGHWSGGETAGQHDECPLLEELACLSHRTEDIILVDDARLFLCAPPPPHNPSHWPTISNIVNALPASANRFIQIVDDVIFIVPNEAALRNYLIDHVRRARKDSKDVRAIQQNKVPFKTRAKQRLSRIGRRITGQSGGK